METQTMPMTLTELEKEAFQLPREEQLRLAQDIFSQGPISKIEKAWYEEAAKRSEEIKAGKVELISSEKVFADAYAKLKEMRNRK
jgi:hypothetical protein